MPRPVVVDARSGEHMQVPADALAWTVARLAVAYGLASTGDMLSLVGKYIGALAEQDAAKRELERARQAGRLPN